jgi:CHAT domain-containing protein
VSRGVALDFADRELDVIREAAPRVELVRGAAVKKSAFLRALSGEAVVHFAGHTELASNDPLAGALALPEPLTLAEVLDAKVRAKLVVLSSCESLAARADARSIAAESGDEILSLAASFELAGAKNVLASGNRVSDLAAALLMKHFYRAAATMGAAEALRKAELEVRRAHPHAAWWASFSLLAAE